MIRERFQSEARTLFAAFVSLSASLVLAPKAMAYVNDSTAPPGCTNSCGKPCPPASQPPAAQPMQSCGPWMPAGSCGGMPQWWIQEPTVNLRLEDEPLGYNPALGPRVAFDLSYRQRGAVTEDPAIFGVGPPHEPTSVRLGLGRAQTLVFSQVSTLYQVQGFNARKFGRSLTGLSP